MNYQNIEASKLLNELNNLKLKYEEYKSQNLKLDMSRGKPCPQQLDLSMGILDVLTSKDICKAADGTDCRNYGVLEGIPEARALFAEILEVNSEEVIVGGNSSLNMMYDTVQRALYYGVYGGEKPWQDSQKVKFLCPVPGYDRHFSICESLGIEMITVDMKQGGPDMDAVEKLVSEDECIKGIWCVPKYSNPDGITYSDEVVDRLAKMPVKAKDFRIFWDNAYAVHDLYNDGDKLKNILKACNEASNPDRVFIFASTSKISFPGAGVAAMASSDANIKFIKKIIANQTISADKMNQLRHVKYFKDLNGIKEHMKKQASIIAPKFDIVFEILERDLDSKEIAWWNRPNGGYFISLYTLDGCAKRIVTMAKEAGVVLTGAGATYPYGKDPRDRNIRIAPTYPSMEELRKAIEILSLCIQIVSIEKLCKLDLI